MQKVVKYISLIKKGCGLVYITDFVNYLKIDHDEIMTSENINQIHFFIEWLAFIHIKWAYKFDFEYDIMSSG